jgi:hypothetical protein
VKRSFFAKSVERNGAFLATMLYSQKSDDVGESFTFNYKYFSNFGPSPCLLLNDAKKCGKRTKNLVHVRL